MCKCIPVPSECDVIGTCSNCKGRVVRSKGWVAYKLPVHCWDCKARPAQMPIVAMGRKPSIAQEVCR